MMPLALALAAAAQPCPPIAGVNELLRRQGLEFVLLGEFHGTAEIPAVASDILCHAAQLRPRRPLVLAVELPRAEQAAIDGYMRSNGGARAQQALLASPGWGTPDPRRTKAIVDLIEAARKLSRRHDVRLIAFDTPPEPWTSPAREAAMAAALREAAASRPGTLVIAHTGAGHANRGGFTSRPPAFLSAVGHLPAAATVTLAFARVGGRYLACPSGEGGAAPACGPQDVPTRDATLPRSVVLDPTAREGFDGVVYPGGPYTASAPAR